MKLNNTDNPLKESDATDFYSTYAMERTFPLQIDSKPGQPTIRTFRFVSFSR